MTMEACIARKETGLQKKPAAAAAGLIRTDLTYCFVMVQTTADFGVV